jgi:hypothetical protein
MVRHYYFLADRMGAEIVPNRCPTKLNRKGAANLSGHNLAI